MASTCTKQFFEKMKRGNGIEENISYMELLWNDRYERKEKETRVAIEMYQDCISELRKTIRWRTLAFALMFVAWVLTFVKQFI